MSSDKLFDSAFISELKDRTNIADLIGQSVTLKKSGAHSYNCCCPFHDEKTPSFVVDEKENRFKCFGGSCGEAGDPIDWLLKYKRLNFVEAVKELCQINGVRPPESDSESKQQSTERRQYLNVVRQLTNHLSAELKTKAGSVISSKIPATSEFKDKLKMGTLTDAPRLERILNGASMSKLKKSLHHIELLSSDDKLNIPAAGVFMPVTSRRGVIIGLTHIDGNLNHRTLPESETFRPQDEIINISNVEHEKPMYFAFNFKNAIQMHRLQNTDNILISPLGDGLITEAQLTKANRVSSDLTFIIPREPSQRHSALASLLINYKLGDEIKLFDMKSGENSHLLDFIHDRWDAIPEQLKEFYVESIRGTESEILLDVMGASGKDKTVKLAPNN